ncbi:serine hydrolase domain-containing protein [Egbenema bharatensis]|uniref:serine hydrolase domain-containing protein n=1 Tax=Egbenema bharatensis TaxID=3463334 RepID=UPI003A862BF3
MRVVVIALFVALLIILPSIAQVPETQIPPPDAELSQLEPFDPPEVEAFVEEFVRAQSLPGAAFVLVQDGAIVAQQGYGYADIAQQRPVDAETTLFRIASISKLVTTVALLQLYEQGQVSLNDNVNRYLQAFQIDETYPAPITVENLLTHTDGLDVSWGIGAANTTGDRFLPLAQFLQDRLPPRVVAPDRVYLYGDAGMTVAGYLVQALSSIPFAQYVEQQIFQPLGMERSSFQQPLPPSLAADVAVGYEADHSPVPFQRIQSVPAIAMSTTTTDMANFMLAQLQGGQFNNSGILSEETTRQMQQQHFTHHPRLPGSAYGFYLRQQSDRLILEHGGVMPGFSSTLFLIPEDNLGFFLASNSFRADLPERLMQAFLAHYYPSTPSPPRDSPTGTRLSPDLSRFFVGTYRFNRYPHRSFEKLTALIGLVPEIRIEVTEDGALTIQGARYTQIEPLLFQLGNSSYYSAFRQNDRGQITHVFLGQSVFQAFEKLAWFETVRFNALLLGICALIFLSMGIVYLIDFYRRLTKRLSGQRRLPQWALHLAGLTSTLNLLFVMGMVFTLVFTDIWVLYEGMPWLALLLLGIPLITTGLTLGLAVGTIAVWANYSGALWQKLHYSLVTLAAIGFIWFVEYWNLLGFRFA